MGPALPNSDCGAMQEGSATRVVASATRHPRETVEAGPISAAHTASDRDVTLATSISSPASYPPAPSSNLFSIMATNSPVRSLRSDEPASPAPLFSDSLMWDIVLGVAVVVHSPSGSMEAS